MANRATIGFLPKLTICVQINSPINLVPLTMREWLNGLIDQLHAEKLDSFKCLTLSALNRLVGLIAQNIFSRLNVLAVETE